MSDFDKEAEREKLREQFAADERERASTQRMSELLLQGATMTNKHCDVHGDPVFRQNGEEFCPTCRTEGQSTPASAESAAPDSSPEPDASRTAPDHDGRADERPTNDRGSVADANDATDARPSAGAESEAEVDDRRPDPSPAVEESSADLSPEDIAGTDWQADAARSPASTPASDTNREARGSRSPTDLGDARGSLSRTLTRLAEEAERADDLSRAREYLAAVEDAADALAAVRDAER
jgi:uncharacterized Zn finger protein (UPF0148 family)